MRLYDLQMKMTMIKKIDHIINRPRRRHEHKYTQYSISR